MGLWRFLLAATAARVADEMVGVALVLLALDRTGDPALAGLMVTAYALPSIASGPVVGAVLDRSPHRTRVLAANGLLLAAACVGVERTLGHGPSAVPLLLTAVTGVALPLTSGGYSSLVPLLVPRDQLTRANSFDAGSFSVAAILGPGLAGALAGGVGSPAAVLAISGLAVLGALATATLPRVARADADRPRLGRVVRDGLVHLATTAPLRGATLATVVAFLAAGLLSTAFPLRAAEVGAAESAGGYLWTAMEVGSLVAVLLLSRRLLAGDRPERVVFGCLTAHGAVLLTVALAPALPQALVAAAAAGLANGATLPAIMATRQRHTPVGLLSQVSVTGGSLKIAAFAAGAAAGGWLVPAVGAGAGIAVAAAGQLLAAGLGALAARSGSRPAALVD
ncbi:MFS transporter [Actinokineospora bangkokensis]|uniref:MFS transporter n=1 Tax=Actinokineospora bangkokensis TaxID=1193682 RepID=A0A1Q9LRA6_9PSEU|nr:MFS transporter [Actinokineospora bangkokensis]OLR94543.1 hypothetical protein BJP25_12450 [Actinokineospora bangkokensis]